MSARVDDGGRGGRGDGGGWNGEEVEGGRATQIILRSMGAMGKVVVVGSSVDGGKKAKVEVSVLSERGGKREAEENVRRGFTPLTKR